MKILIVSPHSPSDDAIGAYTAQMAAELSKKAAVVVLANKGTNLAQQSMVTENKMCNKYIVSRIWSPGIFYPFSIFRGIIRHKPDIVHFQHEYFLYGAGFRGLLFPFVLFVTRLTKIPVIITMHHVIPRKEAGIFRRFFRVPIPTILVKMFLTFFNKLLSSPDKISVPSSNFKQTLSHDYKVACSKIEVVPHFMCSSVALKHSKAKEKLSVSSRKKLNLDGNKVALFFGYIRPSKGIEYVIDALPSVIKSFPNVIFSIVGRAQPDYSDYLEYLRRLVKEREVTQYVRFENYVPDESLPLHFAAADVVIFPYSSTVGTIPIAYMRAAEFGKPIIATTVEHFNQEFVDHENALLVPPKDSQALSKSIVEIFSDRVLSKKLGTNITKYCSRYSEEKAIEKTLEIYQELIEHRKKQ